MGLPTPWTWQPETPSRLDQPLQLLHLTGADTGRFLHGQTSAAIESAAPGSWISTCCITPTGRMRAVAEVLMEQDGAWLLLRAGAGDPVREALDRVLFPADQVTLGALETGRWLTEIGPDRSAAENPEGGARQWQALPDGQGWRLGPAWALREGVPLPEELGCRSPLTEEEQEHWRVQEGEPAAPEEVNEDTNPFELGLADRVSLSKGCYVGQETLAKLATYDGVKQQLRRWYTRPRPDGQADPLPGSTLLDPAGRRAGRVTSALRLSGGDWIGLALIRRQALELPSLQLENGLSGSALQISQPAGFIPPPVGSGSQAR